MRRMSPCWIWLKGRYKKAGHGCIGVGRGGQLVHKVVWEAANGPVPGWGELHHLCFNRLCYRPSHLMVVSRLAHAYLERKETCRRGHRWSEQVPYLIGGRTRLCRICRREKSRANWKAWYGRHLAEARENHRKQAALWRAANPEKTRAIQARYDARVRAGLTHSSAPCNLQGPPTP